MLNYTVVFQLVKEPVPVWPVILFAMIAVFSFAISIRLWFIKFPSRLIQQTRIYPTLIGIVFLVLLASMHEMKESFDDLLEAVHTGKVKVAEGVVENFQPMPSSGNGVERFSVNGQNFDYSDFDESGGFHKTTNRGGPVRSGIPIRVTYVAREGKRNTIVKLELGREAVQ